MFDLGFSELFLIGIVALIVLGPERLPKAARTVGALLRRARSSYMSLKSDIERELAADELKRSMNSMTEPARDIRQTMTDVDKAGRDFEAELRQVDRDNARAEIDSALGVNAATSEPAATEPTIVSPGTDDDAAKDPSVAPQEAEDAATDQPGPPSGTRP